jgi:hypothetical protein
VDKRSNTAANISAKANRIVHIFFILGSLVGSPFVFAFLNRQNVTGPTTYPKVGI